MANKFQQSVLQRLEQEQKVQPKAKPQTKIVTKKADEAKIPAASIKNPINTPDTSDNNVNLADVTKIDAQSLPKDNNAPNIPDISDYLRLEPGRTAKNKTFYLDVEVIDALCAAARRQNVTDSKLCNDILRRVLGVGAVR